LDRELQAVLARIKARRQIINSLLAGQMTLDEAVARFRELDGNRIEGEQDWLRRAYPAASDQERYLRQILGNLESQLLEQPKEAAERGARLRTELEARLACGAIGVPQ